MTSMSQLRRFPFCFGPPVVTANNTDLRACWFWTKPTDWPRIRTFLNRWTEFWKFCFYYRGGNNNNNNDRKIGVRWSWRPPHGQKRQKPSGTSGWARAAVITTVTQKLQLQIHHHHDNSSSSSSSSSRRRRRRKVKPQSCNQKAAAVTIRVGALSSKSMPCHCHSAQK